MEGKSEKQQRDLASETPEVPPEPEIAMLCTFLGLLWHYLYGVAAPRVMVHDRLTWVDRAVSRPVRARGRREGRIGAGNALGVTPTVTPTMLLRVERLIIKGL